ncbi:MAG: glutaconate CoA-transferase [Dethiobacter sp.]|nr:glutaconate CoA-transferase [Dethiobacter sp.]MCL5983018.1 glutaconate CoA-transferase [Bacillota bacterium]
MGYASDYTLAELLVATAAREIKDGDVVFVGVGIPGLGAGLAKLTHAPNMIMAMECGSIGSQSYRLVLGIGDNACVENAICNTSLWRLFSDQQRGYFDVGMISGAQVDKYGNLNSTTIIGNRSYQQPKTRLPGSGGANDIASSARKTILMINMQARRFMERVDYITSPGYLDGYEAREKAGLLGGGPEAIITDKCLMRFDPVTKEAFVASVHPGATMEEIKSLVSWDLKFSPDLQETEPPTDEQVRVTRTLDSEGIYLRGGLKGLTFDRYMAMLENSRDVLSKVFMKKLYSGDEDQC